VDVSKFSTLAIEKKYGEDGADAQRAESEAAPVGSKPMTRAQRYYDDPRFTLKVLEAGGVLLYELKKQAWRHEQLTLCFNFIQEMARCDLIELWYGGAHKGIRDVFPLARVGYGCTDSLALELTLSPAHFLAGETDARVVFAKEFRHMLDISNVSSTSTFFSSLPSDVHDTLKLNAGVWGCLKEETGMAGVDSLIVNGPNRWAYRVVQCSDTPPKYVGHKKRDVLKSIPLAWKSKFTLEEYAASWYKAKLPEPLPMDPSTVIIHGGTVEPIQVVRARKALSLWGNASCIVSRTEPFKQYALGSQEPEALALLSGEAW
jgi:hypothetical protein